MPHWNDFVSNDATPHDRRLLLITQPDTFDAAQKHIYDVVVGYQNKHSGAFVQAVAPSDKATGRTLRVHKWQDLPELPKLTLRDMVGLDQAPYWCTMPIVVKLTQKPSTPLSNEQLGLRFATESEAYADAAMLLENSRFHSARYYLFCHAFELILKSFILSAGEDQSKLFGVGHRLNEALAEATRLGYSPSDAGLASIIDWLHPFHEGNHFRYARGGYQMLPTAENILTAFKAAHLEIAPLARTAYLKKYPSPV